MPPPSSCSLHRRPLRLVLAPHPRLAGRTTATTAPRPLRCRRDQGIGDNLKLAPPLALASAVARELHAARHADALPFPAACKVLRHPAERADTQPERRTGALIRALAPVGKVYGDAPDHHRVARAGLDRTRIADRDSFNGCARGSHPGITGGSVGSRGCGIGDEPNHGSARCPPRRRALIVPALPSLGVHAAPTPLPSAPLRPRRLPASTLPGSTATATQRRPTAAVAIVEVHDGRSRPHPSYRHCANTGSTLFAWPVSGPPRSLS